jgi:hypothetical protein
MLDLMPRTPAEGARGPLGLGRAAILGTSAIFFAAASVAPAVAGEVDELKSEMRQLLDRIDNLEQSQQRTQIEVDQIEANSAWLINEAPVRARASVITPVKSQGDYVSGGDFPGSFKLPGSDSSMAIYGFIRADYSLNLGVHHVFPLIGTPVSLPNRGTAGATNTGQFNARGSESQINIESRTPSEYGELRTLVQFDWYQNDIDESNNNSTINEITAGLRLAQASIGPWTFGNHWTTFVDLSQYAETADWNNMNNASLCRCWAISYADSLGGGFSFGVSLVEPVTQIDTSLGAGAQINGTSAPAASAAAGQLISRNTGMPDFQGNLKYGQDWGHIFFGAQVRQVAYTLDDAAGINGGLFRSTTGKSEDSELGWGVSLGLNLFDPLGLHPRDRFYTNFQYGEAMRGLIDLSLDCAFSGAGCNYEAVVNPITGELDASTQIGAMVHYQHWWTDTIRSTIGYSFVRNIPDAKFNAVGSTISAHYGIVNLWWSPLPRVNLGLETQYLEHRAKGFGTLDGNNTVQIQATAMLLW